MSVLRAGIGAFFRVAARVASAAYGAEGLNVVLQVMPTYLIDETLRRGGATIGERVRFNAPLRIHAGGADRGVYFANLTVGDDCYFGRELFLDLTDRIEIESNVTVSHRVMILTHTDAGPSPLRDGRIPTTHAPVTIRHGAYVGASATILEGVVLGEQSIVAAAALVRRPVPPGYTVGGVPAKELRSSSEQEEK